MCWGAQGWARFVISPSSISHSAENLTEPYGAARPLLQVEGLAGGQIALSKNVGRDADMEQPASPQGSFWPQAKLQGGSPQPSEFHTLMRTGSACQTGHTLGGAVYEARPPAYAPHF